MNRSCLYIFTNLFNQVGEQILTGHPSINSFSIRLVISFVHSHGGGGVPE